MIKTKPYRFSLPGLDLSLQIVDAVEELITDPEDDDKIPYWAELWPASQGLAAYIWEHSAVEGSTLLELGAGLGLPGLVAACKGARVTLTDFQPEALRLIADNARINGIERVTTRPGDWRDFRIKERYQWIIGSDILYNPQSNPYVEQILASNLEPGGHLLFSHPHRPVTLEFIERISRRLGLIDEQTIAAVQTDDAVRTDYQITIHHLWRE